MKLLQEKDEEIKNLNREVGRLQHELTAFIEEKKTVQS